jgi:hypothetical protein
MSDTTINQSEASPKPVTVQHDFWSATTSGDKLFSVRGGIPLGDAFDQLSLLIATSQSAIEAARLAASSEDVPQGHWAATHLLEFSYALVQSMHQGVIDHEKR